uniref:TraB domain-containing protein n=1 Tax=Rhabditophanes sp. KR3021 TaxID=114890 RepID=A0AC35U6K1_9BILA
MMSQQDNISLPVNESEITKEVEEQSEIVQEQNPDERVKNSSDDNIEADTSVAEETKTVRKQGVVIFRRFAFNRMREENPELPEETVFEVQHSKVPSEVLEKCGIDGGRLYLEGRIVLVGTAHFSRQSQDDVAKVILKLLPDFIMLELCPERIGVLHIDEAALLRETEIISFTKVSNNIKQFGVAMGILHSVISYSSAQFTKKLGMAPGGEFRRACLEAKKLPGTAVMFCDRPIQITLKRAIGSLNFFQKMRILFDLLISYDPDSVTENEIERIKNKDVIEQLMDEFSDKYPIIQKIFLTERDMYMSSTIWRVYRDMFIQKFEAAKAGSIPMEPINIVAVVGLGHVKGINKYYGQDIDIEKLISLPPSGYSTFFLKLTFKIGFYGTLAYIGIKCTKSLGRKIF